MAETDAKTDDDDGANRQCQGSYVQCPDCTTPEKDADEVHVGIVPCENCGDPQLIVLCPGCHRVLIVVETPRQFERLLADGKAENDAYNRDAAKGFH